MMYHFNFYDIVAQFAWEFQICEIRNVLILGIVVYGLDEIGVFQMWNSENLAFVTSWVLTSTWLWSDFGNNLHGRSIP
jgi:hypothetical protein